MAKQFSSNRTNGVDILTSNVANEKLYNGELVAKPYSVNITSNDPKKDAEGKLSFSYMDVSKPSEEAKANGITKTRFYRTAFKKANSIVKHMDEMSGEETVAFRGSKKAKSETTFENISPEVFSYIRNQIKDKQFTEIGKNNEGKMVMQLKGLIFGEVVTAIVPKFKIFTQNADGKRIPLMAYSYDPYTGKPSKKQATSNTLSAFILDEDLPNALSIMAKMVEREVIGKTVAKIVTTKEEGNETITKIEEEAVTNDGEIIGQEENLDPVPFDEEETVTE